MSTGETWTLGHRPALDGLRGIAVLLVLTTHLRVPGFGIAPAVGVVVFFALSGFLITTLLLERREGLGRFYLRRAARLVPALLACLVLYAALQVMFTGTVGDGRTMLGGVTYTLNWMSASEPFGPTSPIAHLWSLAIEEQFYLVWPLLLSGLVLLPRRWMLALLASAVVLGFVWRVHLLATVGYTRAYYGSDARADELLVGCALAVFMVGRRERRVPGWLVVPLLVGVVAWSWPPHDGVGVGLMPTAVAVLTAGIMYVAVNGDGPRWLAAPWLVWFGQRSYGIYLYHLPLRWAVEQYGTPWWVTAPVALGLALLAAEVSWRLLERPCIGAARQLVESADHVRADRVVPATVDRA